MKYKSIGGAVIVAAICVSASGSELTPIERLGKAIFFDARLSNPPGQACASCHAPKTGFTSPDSDVNAAGAVVPGAVPTRFGNRKPPSAAYCGESPLLSFAEETGWFGGMFWDGRATGWILGDPLAEQARGPFLNPLEHNMPNMRAVVTRVAKSPYAHLFLQVWGPGSLDFRWDVEGSYERIARSIAAYERSREVNPFSSKYDRYLEGSAQLSSLELQGLSLFEGQGMCSTCHPNRPGLNGEPPLFTAFGYENLGSPKNPLNPFYTATWQVNPDGEDWIDPGLGGFLKKNGEPAEVYAREWGKHKVPSLRNVDRRPSPEFVKAYGHNGFFKTLESFVAFCNTRDVAAWPPPEVAGNVTPVIGNLLLTPEQEAAIVAFLKTLTDADVPHTGKP